MPKLVDYDQMRNDISKTALDVFFKKGFHQTNLNDVAKEYGVGRTTLYQYFKNKEELYVYCIKSWAQQTIEALEKGIQSVPDSKGQVMYIMKEMLSLKHHSSLIFMTLEQFPSIGEKHAELYLELNNTVEAIKGMIQRSLEKACNEGCTMKMSASAMASMMYALIEGFVIEMTVSTKKTVDECLKTSKEVLDGLIREAI